MSGTVVTVVAFRQRAAFLLHRLFLQSLWSSTTQEERAVVQHIGLLLQPQDAPHVDSHEGSSSSSSGARDVFSSLHRAWTELFSAANDGVWASAWQCWEVAMYNALGEAEEEIKDQRMASSTPKDSSRPVFLCLLRVMHALFPFADGWFEKTESSHMTKTQGEGGASHVQQPPSWSIAAPISPAVAQILSTPMAGQ